MGYSLTPEARERIKARTRHRADCKTLLPKTDPNYRTHDPDCTFCFTLSER